MHALFEKRHVADGKKNKLPSRVAWMQFGPSLSLENAVLKENKIFRVD